MTSAPEAHKTAGVVATVRRLPRSHGAAAEGGWVLDFDELERMRDFAQAYRVSLEDLEAIALEAEKFIFSTPSVPAVAELSRAGHIERIAEAMWRAEVSDLRAAHNARQSASLSEQSDQMREKWMRLACAAVSAFPAVAELSGDGMAQPIASGAERELRATLKQAREAMNHAFMACPVPKAGAERRAWSSLVDAIQAADAALDIPPSGDDLKALDAEARTEDGGEVERAVLAERETCLSVISKVRDHWRNAEKEWSSASDLRDLQSFLVGKAAKHKADFAEEIMAAIRALSTPVPAASKPEGETHG